MVDKNLLIGLVSGIVISNGNVSSLVIGICIGWLITDPEANYLKIKEKLKKLNNKKSK